MQPDIAEIISGVQSAVTQKGEQGDREILTIRRIGAVDGSERGGRWIVDVALRIENMPVINWSATYFDESSDEWGSVTRKLCTDLASRVVALSGKPWLLKQ